MRLRMLLVPVAASAALLVGACTSGTPTVTPTPTTNGVEAKTADQIIGDATKALEDAKSVHVEGTVGEAPLAITLDLVYAGANVEGTVGVMGIDAEVIKVGPDVYVKADTALFATFIPQDQQALLPLLNGKWVKVNEGLIGTVLPVPLTISALVAPTKPVEKGDITTVNGTKAITVKDGDGSEFHVAIEGEPYLLDIKGDTGSVTFSDFDETATVEAPKESDVVDILKMLGLG